MIVTGWSNGQTGFGFKVTTRDRDQYFEKNWKSVIVHLPTNEIVEVNIDKPSFWNGCRELISGRFGRWLHDNQYAPWPKGKPPKFELVPVSERAFQLKPELLKA